MITLSLSRARTARIWLGELPSAIYEGDSTIQAVLEARTASLNSARVVAVEMKQHRGGRMLYGLVGGAMIPNHSSKLSVSVQTSTSIHHPFPNSLMTPANPNTGFPQNKDVFTGMLEQYAHGVISGVHRASDQLTSLYAGDLVVNCGAYHIHESAQAFFAHISNIVVRIMNLDEDLPSEEELAGMIEIIDA